MAKSVESIASSVTTQVSQSIATTTAVLLSSVVICAANQNRKGFSIWNNGANSAYITWGPVSSSSSPVIILATFSSYICLGPLIWTGIMSALRNTGSGNIVVTEFF
jgi:hypothetical protein